MARNFINRFIPNASNSFIFSLRNFHFAYTKCFYFERIMIIYHIKFVTKNRKNGEKEHARQRVVVTANFRSKGFTLL